MTPPTPLEFPVPSVGEEKGLWIFFGMIPNVLLFQLHTGDCSIGIWVTELLQKLLIKRELLYISGIFSHLEILNMHLHQQD